MFIKKYAEYLKDEVYDILYRLSLKAFIVCRVEPQLYNISMQDMIKIYIEVLNDILTGKINNEDIDNKIEAMKIAFIRHIKDDDDKIGEEIYGVFENDINKVIYIEVYNKLCEFVELIKVGNENSKTDNIQILNEAKELISELDVPFSILQNLNGIMEGKNYLLRVPIDKFISELENSNLKIRDKYKVLDSYLLKVKKDCDNIERKQIKLDDTTKRIYEKIRSVYDKYEIKADTHEIKEDVFRKIYSEFGASDRFIDEIVEYANNEHEKKQESKTFNSNINSGIDEYVKNEEKKENLIKTLSEYVDIRDMHLEKFLCRKEMNLVISIMKKLKYSNEDIKKVVWNNDLLMNKEDIIIKCNYIIDRARFYSSKYGFEKEFKDFEEYYNGYFSTKDKEEKTLYLEFMASTYKEINSFIPRTYEYEFSIDDTESKKVYQYKNIDE